MDTTFHATTIGTGPFHGVVLVTSPRHHKMRIWRQLGSGSATENEAYRKACRALPEAAAVFMRRDPDWIHLVR
jgi:hypothetical protein